MTDTIGVYDQLASEYVDMAKDHAPAELIEFIRSVRDGGRVLDLGCGPGQHAEVMAAAGLDVLAVDGSEEMVALAGRIDGVDARIVLFDDIAQLGPVDGIWASFSLLHAPRADLPRHLSALHGLCSANAPICLGMKLGTGETTDRLGRAYSYYSRSELEQHLRDAGFTPQNATLGAAKGLAGHVEDWIAISAVA